MSNSTVPEAGRAKTNNLPTPDYRGRQPDHPEYCPYGDPAVNARHRDERARTDAERHDADLFRVQAAAADGHGPIAADDAMADLRKVMAENGDVLQSSDVLANVARFADSRHAERYGTTFGVMLRAVLAIPPQVVLPPIIGGEVSLNLLLAVVGDSGGGKGTADKTAVAAVRVSAGGHRVVENLPMIPVGTGEGINRTYARAERDRRGGGPVVMRWHTDRALFGCRDIASMDALMSRRGSTLIPELLKAYMGEELGFANAEQERRVILPMHSYRLCLSAGVQPDNGMVLLDDQARRDGVPQRFLWAPVRPGVSRGRIKDGSASNIAPIELPVPTFGIDPSVFTPPSELRDDTDWGMYDPTARTLVPVDVAGPIRQQILDTDSRKDLDPFGRSDDRLSGHRLLAQLKVAAALAVLHNREAVTVEDWQRAERFISVSSAVAAAVEAVSATAAIHGAEAKGEIDGFRLAAADDARAVARVHTVRERVVRYLRQQNNWVPSGALRKSLSSPQRSSFDDAILALLQDKVIERRLGKRSSQEVIEFRIKSA